MKNEKLAKLGLLLTVSATLIGCGSGFSPQNIESLNASAAGSSETTPEAPATLTLNERPDLGTSWLKESGFGATGSLYFQTVVKLPYGWAYSAASVATRFASPLACQFEGVESESSPHKSYASNEIPCGRLISGGLKQVTMINVDPYDEVKSGVTIHVDGAQIPVWISREQFSGVYSESRLDSKGIEQVRSSKNFGDDLSIRYEPRGSSMRMHLCAAVPGFNVSSAQQRIRAKAYKKVLGIKITEATDVTVNLGSASFDYVRGCFTTDVSFVGSNFVPTFALQASEKPALANVRYSGLAVRFENYWLRLLDRVLDWFKVGIRRKIISIANREAQKVIDRDLETGEWFTKVHGEATLNSLAEKVNRSTLRSLRSSGLPLSGEELKTLLQRQCRLLPIFEKAEADFREVCLQALEAVKVAVVPFYRDPNLEAQGCYNHFANIHSTRDTSGAWKWWAKKCGFSMQIQVQVDVNISKDRLAKIQKILASLENLESWVDRASRELGWKVEDQAVIVLLLEEALAQGEKITSLADLARVANRYRPLIEERMKNWASTNI